MMNRIEGNAEVWGAKPGKPVDKLTNGDHEKAAILYEDCEAFEMGNTATT